MDILIVCTGNICRSPMAEALLRAKVTDGGIDASVSSAGSIGDGDPASHYAVKVMRARGLDISEHASRLVTPEIVDRSDLIVGMAREHVRQIVVADPSVFPRTYTLKELVRRGEELGGRGDGETIASWLDRMHEDRTPSLHLGSSSDDDVADPIGQRKGIYERTARELSDLIDRLVSLLWQDATLPIPIGTPEQP